MAKRKPTGESTDDLISLKEAAELRGVTRQSIQDLMARGRLEPVVVAGRRLLRRSDVVNYEPGKAGRPAGDVSK